MIIGMEQTPKAVPHTAADDACRGQDLVF